MAVMFSSFLLVISCPPQGPLPHVPPLLIAPTSPSPLREGRGAVTSDSAQAGYGAGGGPGAGDLKVGHPLLSQDLTLECEVSQDQSGNGAETERRDPEPGHPVSMTRDDL